MATVEYENGKPQEVAKTAYNTLGTLAVNDADLAPTPPKNASPIISDDDLATPTTCSQCGSPL